MEENNKAFSEVYDIINHLNKNLYNKIPKKIIQLIEDNKNNEYEPNIDYNKSINEQSLLRDTRTILSLIYRDYICSEEEKTKLINADIMELKREETEKSERYTAEDLFKRNNSRQEEKIQEKALVEYKENFFTKIINKIKNFFKMKN